MAPAQTVAPIIFNYKRGLLTQASGRWQALSSDFVSDFSRYYPEIDLHQIRFATNINTIHGAAITFGNRIFFPSGLDLNGQSGQRWILHELQHSVQYALKGGEQQFLSEYMLHAAGRILACGCVEVHDDISLERDAIAKANYVFQDFGWGFFVTNSCDKPINLAVHYRRTDDQWETRYWWSFGPNESAFLASSDVRLHSRNRIFYFYAYAPETNIQWAGNDPNAAWEVGNAGERPFMRRDYDSDAENFGLHITCNN